LANQVLIATWIVSVGRICRVKLADPAKSPQQRAARIASVQALLLTRWPRAPDDDDVPADAATAALNGTWKTTKPEESRASMKKRCVS
jgi:hypothetical protein